MKTAILQAVVLATSVHHATAVWGQINFDNEVTSTCGLGCAAILPVCTDNDFRGVCEDLVNDGYAMKAGSSHWHSTPRNTKSKANLDAQPPSPPAP
jgi:hypothetical protein